MNLHEYQAKELLKKYNVPVQEGIACNTATEAEAEVQDITNKFIALVDKHLASKEKEIMSV